MILKMKWMICYTLQQVKHNEETVKVDEEGEVDDAQLIEASQAYDATEKSGMKWMNQICYLWKPVCNMKSRLV